MYRYALAIVTLFFKFFDAKMESYTYNYICMLAIATIALSTCTALKQPLYLHKKGK